MLTPILDLINDHQINGVDGTAVGVGIAAFFQWLPHISALLSILWIGLRIWVTIRDDFLNKKDKDGNK